MSDFQLDDDQLAQIGQRLVHEHASDAADVQVVVQMMQERRLIGDALDQARFAWRHLADDRDQHGILAARDRGDVHEGVIFLQVHVAVRFAEAAFRLEPLGVDIAFDDDLGFRRHDQIDGLGLADADRGADQPAGDRELVEMLRQLVHRGEGDRRRCAEQQRDRHLFAARLVFQPVLVDALVQLDLWIHSHPGAGF